MQLLLLLFFHHFAAGDVGKNLPVEFFALLQCRFLPVDLLRHSVAGGYQGADCASGGDAQEFFAPLLVRELFEMLCEKLEGGHQILHQQHFDQIGNEYDVQQDEHDVDHDELQTRHGLLEMVFEIAKNDEGQRNGCDNQN